MSISVVVPVHNGAQTLGRCLEALRCSSYINFECIVVDDGSTDSSHAIAEKFAPRLVRGVGTPKGAAHARNRGVEVASGGILLFVDADVAVQPDTLDKVAKLFASSPSIDAAFGGYDDHPAVSSFVSQYKNLFHHYVHQHAREDAGTFWTGCGAVRTSVFQAIGGFDETYSSIEDIELGYRLREAGHRIYLDKSMQVTHLKHWTLRGMIKSDLLDR